MLAKIVPFLRSTIQHVIWSHYGMTILVHPQDTVSKYTPGRPRMYNIPNSYQVYPVGLSMGAI